MKYFPFHYKPYTLKLELYCHKILLFLYMDYILDLVMATHKENPYIREGASPRAAQAIIRTARARAFMEGRFNVAFEDVKSVAYPVLRHRILLSFDAISEGVTEDAIIEQLL